MFLNNILYMDKTSKVRCANELLAQDRGTNSPGSLCTLWRCGQFRVKYVVTRRRESKHCCDIQPLVLTLDKMSDENNI